MCRQIVGFLTIRKSSESVNEIVPRLEVLWKGLRSKLVVVFTRPTKDVLLDTLPVCS